MSPFPEARGCESSLCGSSSQWRTRALEHKKIKCMKAAGAEGESCTGLSIVYYVPVCLPLHITEHTPLSMCIHINEIDFGES